MADLLDTALAPPFAELPRAQALQGPAQYLFTAEDVLQIDAFNAALNVTVTISGVMLSSRLQLIPFSFTLTPPVNRTLGTVRVPIDSGWLQHLRVIVSTGAPLLGQTFVFVRIARGTTANALVVGTICSGYVTASTDLYWPGGTTQLPLDGEGFPRTVLIANPGAGLEWSQTIPAGARWELVSVSQLFTASGVAGNRNVRLILDDSANVFYQSTPTTTILANQILRISFGAGAGGPGSDGTPGITAIGPLPNDVYLPSGFRIRSTTGNLDVNDAHTLVTLFVREWLEGA